MCCGAWIVSPWPTPFGVSFGRSPLKPPTHQTKIRSARWKGIVRAQNVALALDGSPQRHSGLYVYLANCSAEMETGKAPSTVPVRSVDRNKWSPRITCSSPLRFRSVSFNPARLGAGTRSGRPAVRRIAQGGALLASQPGNYTNYKQVVSWEERYPGGIPRGGREILNSVCKLSLMGIPWLDRWGSAEGAAATRLHRD